MDTAYLPRYLALFHSDSLATLNFSRLLQQYSRIETISRLSAEELEKLGFSAAAISTEPLNQLQRDRVERDLQWASNPHHSILCYESQHYPELLREIDSPPPLLYVVGNPQALSSPQLAIVGSRKASSYGSRNAYWLAHELAQAGLTICSGLARGIDSKAHQGALDCAGETVAVMGTGADIRYPPANKKLAVRIQESGALVSEFTLGTPALPQNFPRRNRIISGMSLGTLVVEASCRSGSLITARLALEQNRDVFAIPGSILGQSSRGTHQLIKQGAKLIENPQDILQELGWVNSGEAAEAEGEEAGGLRGRLKVDETSRVILEQMGYQECLPQSLIERTGFNLPQLNSLLLLLELEGAVENKGGRYRRLK